MCMCVSVCRVKNKGSGRLGWLSARVAFFASTQSSQEKNIYIMYVNIIHQVNLNLQSLSYINNMFKIF